MLRLAHRILSQKAIELPNYPGSNRKDVVGLHHATIEFLEEGEPIIVADNIAEYVNNLNRNLANRIISYKEFPPCPPPFPFFFVEWNCPPIRYPDNRPFKELGLAQIGCQVKVYDDVPAIIRQLELHERLGKDETSEIVGKLHWGYVGVTYISGTNGRAVPIESTWLLLDREAHYLKMLLYNYLAINEGEAQQQFCGHLEAAEIMMMTLGFMQCKNVNRIDVTDLEGPPPKWCRRQRVPELKYHALKIDPNFGTKPRSGDRKTEGDRSGKALHICRGHFVHYVNDGVSKGLFGKGIYGTFWVPAHIRGSLDHGKVVSTYNVMAPTPQPTLAV